MAIGHTEHIPAGDACPDCGMSFTGWMIEHGRMVEDIELARSVVDTCYVIERR